MGREKFLEDSLGRKVWAILETAFAHCFGGNFCRSMVCRSVSINHETEKGLYPYCAGLCLKVGVFIPDEDDNDADHTIFSYMYDVKELKWRPWWSLLSPDDFASFSKSKSILDVGPKMFASLWFRRKLVDDHHVLILTEGCRYHHPRRASPSQETKMRNLCISCHERIRAQNVIDFLRANFVRLEASPPRWGAANGETAKVFIEDAHIQSSRTDCNALEHVRQVLDHGQMWCAMSTVLHHFVKTRWVLSASMSTLDSMPKRMLKHFIPIPDFPLDKSQLLLFCEIYTQSLHAGNAGTEGASGDEMWNLSTFRATVASCTATFHQLLCKEYPKFHWSLRYVERLMKIMDRLSHNLQEPRFSVIQSASIWMHSAGCTYGEVLSYLGEEHASKNLVAAMKDTCEKIFALSGEEAKENVCTLFDCSSKEVTVISDPIASAQDVASDIMMHERIFFCYTRICFWARYLSHEEPLIVCGRAKSGRKSLIETVARNMKFKTKFFPSVQDARNYVTLQKASEVPEIVACNVSTLHIPIAVDWIKILRTKESSELS